MGLSVPHRAVLGFAVLGFAIASILMLASSGSPRAAWFGPGCAGSPVVVMSSSSDPAAADVGATDVEVGIDAAAGEFGLPRPAADTVWTRWPDVVAYADVHGVIPTSVADGSPHRPPRA